MIRDPSDGSVRVQEHQRKPLDAQTNRSKSDDLSTSGLPAPSTKTKYQERLERSREWLRQYRTNPESVARLMGEQGE